MVGNHYGHCLRAFVAGGLHSASESGLWSAKGSKVQDGCRWVKKAVKVGMRVLVGASVVHLSDLLCALKSPSWRARRKRSKTWAKWVKKIKSVTFVITD